MDMLENVGFDEVLAEEKPKEDKIVDITQAKPARRPYCVWTVKGEDYKLRLTGSVIARLEGTYRKNLLTVLTEDSQLPPLSTMLTVIQAAMQQHHHGVRYSDVQRMFDDYVDEGGDQTKLYGDVIMNLLMVSGFFTPSQEEVLKEELSNLDSSI